MIPAHVDAMIGDGRLEQARAALMRLLPRSRGGEVEIRLALVLSRLGQREQALFYAGRARASRPDDAGVLRNVAAVQQTLGMADEALATARRVLELAPHAADFRAAVAQSFMDTGRPVDALEMVEPGLAPDADHVLLLAIRGGARVALGEPEAGVDDLARAADLAPHDRDVVLALANAAPYADRAPGFVLTQSRRVEAMLRATVAPPAPPLPPFAPVTRADAERPLRVGIVSSDLREHSVGFNSEPIVEHLPREWLHDTVYYTSPVRDATNERFRAHPRVWRDCADTPKAELARRVRADRIDVLVDFNGHTTFHSTESLFLRAAPVQAHFIGWAGTSGFAGVDWRLVDSLTDPPGSEACFSERLLRMDPCFLAYRPPEDVLATPDTRDEPARAMSGASTGSGTGGADAPRPITFCSFNALSKFNDTTLALWARVLREVPGSRLLLKNAALRDARTRERLLARFARAGVEPARIEMIAFTPSARDHFALYRRADVMLDSYPYHGTMTTTEALMMGVPCVALTGPAGLHQARVALSLLSAVGLADLAPTTPDGFVAAAVGLARDPARLALLRASLRSRVLTSPMCDGPARARAFADALRAMWRDYVERNAVG